MKKLFQFGLFSFLIISFLTSCEKENNQVTSVTISKTTLTMHIGDIDSLYAESEYEGNIVPSVAWSSSDPSVVSVDKNGEISAQKKGNAIITASAGDKSASCKVTVDDEIVTSFINAELAFWGDYYITGNSNNFSLYLTNTQDTLLIEINTDKLSTTGIPAGNYEMIENFDSLQQIVPSTLLPAFVYDGYSYGSFLFNAVAVYPIYSGLATFSNEGNIYTISYNFLDYFGNHIEGEYTGTVNYYDMTTNPSGVASNIKAAKMNKNIRHFIANRKKTNVLKFINAK
ncbi:MAG: Ig-like domain-containing protein [Paludibacteraceae bacterium]|nr:Ig-like domain-containing protein [Paludibacteraceae bacterium]